MIRIALPTGDLRRDTAAVLDAAGIGIPEYAAGSRALRFEMLDGAVLARVFRERDIPVQVAMRNYDVGVCSVRWVEELAQRFPAHNVMRICDLEYARQGLWLAAAGETAEPSVRIASECPNIAEAIARRMRLRRYRIFPVWGSAEAYPPEDADVVLIAAKDARDVERSGLRPIAEALRSSACMIANGHSIAERDLSQVLGRLLACGLPPTPSALNVPSSLALREQQVPTRRDMLRLALPDGHAQPHTVAALRSAGIEISGYDETGTVGRPPTNIEGLVIKVIRPQDMPQQVAVGQFDLAITGRDRLFDHLVQFPSSPVEEVIDLRRSRYSLAVIAKDIDAETVPQALEEWRQRGRRTIRLASEFPNIADHFARERHFGRYSVIPIAGASEGFVPDDAEVLIEGIDTGSSVRANQLKVLERFFESTNCVIANKRRPEGALRPIFDRIIGKLRAGAAEPIAVGGA